MAKKPTKGRIRLGNPIQDDLADFCEAHYGAPQINIIRRAVKAFIKDRLAAEPELKERYEAARKERRGQTESNIHIIKSDNGD